jgi:UDP-N-acetyl-D-galactosamine dehydrogenase
VDPYYLTHKAQAIGYHPEIILAGRRLNDRMGMYAAAQMIKELTRRDVRVARARVLVLGLAFKENCPDLRNTRVVDLVQELRDFHCTVDVHDPWVDADECEREYGFRTVPTLTPGRYDGIVLAVGHQVFREMGMAAIRALGKPVHVVYDLKYLFPADATDLRL